MQMCATAGRSLLSHMDFMSMYRDVGYDPVMEISVSLCLFMPIYGDLCVCLCSFYAHVWRSLYVVCSPICPYMEISVSVCVPLLPIYGDPCMSVCAPLCPYMKISVCLSVSPLCPYMEISVCMYVPLYAHIWRSLYVCADRCVLPTWNHTATDNIPYLSIPVLRTPYMVIVS